LCTIGRICNRCTDFVAMATYNEREMSANALCLVSIVYVAIKFSCAELCSALSEAKR